jgi:xanthine dehydrogenase accessory factor
MLEFYEKIANLVRAQAPFAMVQVVGRQAPSSSKLGDKAIVKKNGRMEGWIGGGCVQGIVLKESADAIASGKPRLVRIGKELQHHQKQEGVMEYRMTCQSEGQVEIYIEPVLPRPHLMVIGKSEIAKALVKLGKAMDFKVTGVCEGANLQTYDKVDELITQLDLSRVDTSRLSFIVVATQGDRDEESLLQALKKESSYVGFISSRKKAGTMSNYLLDAGVDPASLDRLHTPAGIDINAKKPDEVAVSIMAEIIRVKNNLDLSIPTESSSVLEEEAPSYYINPVCGVPVDMKHPKHVMQYGKETVYFCCDGCKIKFEKDPDKYMKAREAGLPPEGM